ncbi:MAG: AzlD family protein, partial [Mesorhizobium sp.]
VIAPDFVSRDPADLAALAITLLAATRLSMLATVVIGVASAGALRWLIG